MKTKCSAPNKTLYGDVCARRSSADDLVLAALEQKNDSLGEVTRKRQIGPDQGSFLTFLDSAV